MSIALSLICPVYKVSEFIPDLMRSLLAGVNSSSVEIIFVDDCCPDKSIAVCNQFMLEHQRDIKFRATILNLDVNQGLSGARNEGLKVAKGKYIGFIDSDDVIATSYWKTLSPFIKTSSFDIIEFSYKEFTSNIPDGTDNPVANKMVSSNLNPFKTGFFVWTRLYSKAIAATLSFPEGMIYEDIYFNVHAFAKAKSSVRLNSWLVYYRKRKQSITATRTSQYSHLLINLITALQQTIEFSPNQKEIVSLLQQRTLISILKGLKIANIKELRKYYQLCWPKLSEVKQLSNDYGSSLKSKMSYSLACLICNILK